MMVITEITKEQKNPEQPVRVQLQNIYEYENQIDTCNTPSTITN
jgi:hypothetical protein